MQSEPTAWLLKIRLLHGFSDGLHAVVAGPNLQALGTIHEADGIGLQLSFLPVSLDIDHDGVVALLQRTAPPGSAWRQSSPATLSSLAA